MTCKATLGEKPAFLKMMSLSLWVAKPLVKVKKDAQPVQKTEKKVDEKVKNEVKKDETETKSSEESTVEAKSLKSLRKKNR